MFCSVALLCHIFPRLVPFASIVFRLRSSAVSRKDAWTETSWRVFRLSTSIPGTAIWIGLLQCGISNDEGSTALKWRKVRRLSSCAAMRNAKKGFVTKFELRSFARLGTYCLRISRAFSCQYSIRLRLKWLLHVPIILRIRLSKIKTSFLWIPHGRTGFVACSVMTKISNNYYGPWTVDAAVNYFKKIRLCKYKWEENLTLGLRVLRRNDRCFNERKQGKA